MLFISFFSGEKHSETATGTPYESGMIATGAAHERFSIQFYLMAMFFVVFDVEAVFIFSWAIAVRDLGWTGYTEISIFIVVLVATLAYLWRVGALDWGTSARQKRLQRQFRKEARS